MSDTVTRTPPPAPLLLDIQQLSSIVGRSVASLYRDAAAERLPAPVRIGHSTRWRHADIAAWVELGCPARKEFEARKAASWVARR